MLGTKISFSTAYHPQTDGLAERMRQTMEEILRRFCAYGMQYKDHEGYTHDWVTLLPAVQLAYNSCQHSTTGKSTAMVEKRWHPLFPVDHWKKNLLTIHPTAKEFHKMWKRAFKPYFQTEDETFPSRKKSPTSPEIVELEDSPVPEKKIINARKIRLNGNNQRQYLVIFKNQTGDKEKWLAEDAIPDGNVHIKKFRASRRTEQSHQ
ncbi:hypothetical protein O181_028683 [Austropuccinia psidii MF-1]|uniref:Integrase catalytic domain-containing protein n=1 Tax=Austropuccinia psidii MF-1 TaxID=1389203 RepID=A0A9Q3CUA8_9BASI|nr:hypothetical protein [Austropuccinia psidii MF-1]